VFAKVHLGYRDGVALPTVHTSQPIYGNIVSDRVRGMHVLNLWPYDFPMNAKVETSRPLAQLWRPQVSCFVQTECGLSGLERNRKGQWLAQRWMVEPMQGADIERHAKLAIDRLPQR
jgi:hypothetical protein